MTELFRFSIAWINLPFTVLLAVVLIYWCSVILGAMDHDSSDGDAGVDGHGHGDVGGHADGAGEVHADFHAHADGHLDGHADLHADGHIDGQADLHGDGHAGDHGDVVDADGHEAGGILPALMSVLKFLHVGDVPITMALSVLTTCLWAATILGNWHLNPSRDPGLAVLLFFPHLIVAGIATKILLLPLVPVFRAISSPPSKRTNFIGKIGVVKTEDVTERAGQIEVMVNGISTLLNARAKPGVRAHKGEQVVIYAHNEEKGIYEVTKM